KCRVLWPAGHDFRKRRAGLISSAVGQRILKQAKPAGGVVWVDRAELAHRLFDFLAAVERGSGIPKAHPPNDKIGIELYQLARRHCRIFEAADFIKKFRVIFAHVRITRVELHRTQVMLFGVGVMELRPRHVAESMFGGRSVRFESGGTLSRCGLSGKKISLESGSHVRWEPEAHLIGARERV